RARRRLSRFRKGIIQHRADPYCRRRQDRRLKAIPVHASSTGIAVDYYDHTRSTRNGGGFPIKVDGEIVGAIGVSGAPAVQNDVDCARAALASYPMHPLSNRSTTIMIH